MTDTSSALRSTDGVLLVCPEPLGHNHPAGVGIRFLEIARALLADGQAVTLLSPDGGSVDGCRTGTISPEAIARASKGCRAAVVQGHIANDYFAHAADVPTAVDLYDPYIVENLHYHRSHGPEVFEHDHATLMRSIEKGDFFLCASSSQRLFYAGMFLAARRIEASGFEDDPELCRLIRIVPFGVPPPRRSLPPGSNCDVLFGGIYDWYDPILAIEAVAIAKQSMPGITLTFTRHPNPDSTPQGKAAEAVSFCRDRGYGHFIRFEPWFPYSQRESFYDRYAAALLTFSASLETDLAMRTRIFDYLWGGLPVLSSSAPGTDEIIRRYAAGTIISSNAPEDFAAELVRILKDRSVYDPMQNGTQAYASDHQWPRLLEPLLEFCRTPWRAAAGTVETPARGALRKSVMSRIRRKLGGRP